MMGIQTYGGWHCAIFGCGLVHDKVSSAFALHQNGYGDKKKHVRPQNMMWPKKLFAKTSSSLPSHLELEISTSGPEVVVQHSKDVLLHGLGDERFHWGDLVEQRLQPQAPLWGRGAQRLP